MQEASAADRRRATTLATLAAWAIVVPWVTRAVGLELDVPARLEVADHVVPGVVVLACCVGIAGGSPAATLRLGLIAVALLSGFWITATHATLVPEAIEGLSPWGSALVHLSAGPPIMLMAMWMLLVDPGR